MGMIEAPSRHYLRHPAFFLLLAGLLLLLSSCAPWVGIGTEAGLHPVAELPLPLGATVNGGPLTVDPTLPCQVVLDLSLVSDVLPSLELGGEAERHPYSFPFQWTVSDGAGHPLLEESTTLEGVVEPRFSTSVVAIGSGLLADSRRTLRIFSAPADGRLTITAQLSPDIHGNATVGQPKLLIYDQVEPLEGSNDTAFQRFMGGFLVSWVALIALYAFVLPLPYAPGRPLSATERRWGMACHMAGLLGYLLPLGSLIGPGLIWLLGRRHGAWVVEQGREALNFQISFHLYTLLALLLSLLLVGLPLLLAVFLLHLSLPLAVAIRAGNGERYRYPFTWRAISAP